MLGIFDQEGQLLQCAPYYSIKNAEFDATWTSGPFVLSEKASPGILTLHSNHLGSDSHAPMRHSCWEQHVHPRKRVGVERPVLYEIRIFPPRQNGAGARRDKRREPRSSYPPICFVNGLGGRNGSVFSTSFLGSAESDAPPGNGPRSVTPVCFVKRTGRRTRRLQSVLQSRLPASTISFCACLESLPP